ncbi:disulfide bond formation protein B [Chelativorans sp. Marseille-P2723]|uniref:disulfide bond formation protein B n=1 Tax=Chelativorans sp. Marseille-P2723 TaxID=2709133 RepID=UPI001571216A|nr:disulfide bond formation protein B [Chelativorans sp. Marseille-P2723]
MTLLASTGRLQTLSASFLALGMAATVGTALAFEHIGGYIPCKLCLEQRIPYYIGAPLMLVALASARLRGPALFTRGLLLAGALLMLWSAGLGAYHAGVEWKWWEGPADCGAVAANISTSAENLLEQLNAFVPPACDEAAGRFLGLSFAGWNVIASSILAVIAVRGAFGR